MKRKAKKPSNDFSDFDKNLKIDQSAGALTVVRDKGAKILGYHLPCYHARIVLEYWDTAQKIKRYRIAHFGGSDGLSNRSLEAAPSIMCKQGVLHSNHVQSKLDLSRYQDYVALPISSQAIGMFNDDLDRELSSVSKRNFIPPEFCIFGRGSIYVKPKARAIPSIFLPVLFLFFIGLSHKKEGLNTFLIVNQAIKSTVDQVTSPLTCPIIVSKFMMTRVKWGNISCAFSWLNGGKLFPIAIIDFFLYQIIFSLSELRWGNGFRADCALIASFSLSVVVSDYLFPNNCSSWVISNLEKFLPHSPEGMDRRLVTTAQTVIDDLKARKPEIVRLFSAEKPVGRPSQGAQDERAVSYRK